MSKVNLGYYINNNYDQLLIGFIRDGRLVGKVIFDKYGSFYIGYKYPSWKRYDYTYIGGVNIFNSLDGYLSFLTGADHDQISAYFRCKNILENGDKLRNEYLLWELKVLKGFI